MSNSMERGRNERENHGTVDDNERSCIPDFPPPSYESITSASFDRLDASSSNLPTIRSNLSTTTTTTTTTSHLLPPSSPSGPSSSTVVRLSATRIIVPPLASNDSTRVPKPISGWAYYNPMFQMPLENSHRGRNIANPGRYRSTITETTTNDEDTSRVDPPTRTMIYHPESAHRKRRSSRRCSVKKCSMIWIIVFVVVIGSRSYLKKVSRYRDEQKRVSRRKEAEDLYTEQLKAAAEERDTRRDDLIPSREFEDNSTVDIFDLVSTSDEDLERRIEQRFDASFERNTEKRTIFEINSNSNSSRLVTNSTNIDRIEISK